MGVIKSIYDKLSEPREIERIEYINVGSNMIDVMDEILRHDEPNKTAGLYHSEICPCEYGLCDECDRA